MWKKSLKGRLTLCVIVPVMLALLGMGGAGFYSANKEAEGIYDTELSHVANLMLSLLRAEDQEETTHSAADDDEIKTNPDIIELGNDFENAEKPHESDVAFRIWKDGKLLFRSKKSSDFGQERTMAGFFDEDINGKEWRFYVLPDAKNGYTLEVAQNLKGRILLINKTLSTIFAPLILLLPIILILTWFGLRTGLKPLLAISDAVKHRSSLDLTPLPTRQSLTEIEPLIDSLNGLLVNLDQTLEKERRFTDFAAHELRTPIAIFKTQAQTALKSVDDAERGTILEAQVRAADRATNMVDQLLTLARLEHANIPMEAFSLTDIAQSIMNERQPLAEKKQIALKFDRHASVSIQGNKELLTVALSNLIDNAIKYTPAHGNVTVSVSMQDQTAILSVCDTGLGIPEDKLPFVTERFYRASRHQEQGAGLGLSIVKRSSEIMGFILILRNREDSHGFESILQIPHPAYAS